MGEFSKTGCPVLVSVLFAETGREVEIPALSQRTREGRGAWYGLCLVMIGMGVTPVPVLRLLLLVRLRVFVRIPVIFDQELVPGAILVVVPVVIILVIFIVDPDLNASVLRCGNGHDG